MAALALQGLLAAAVLTVVLRAWRRTGARPLAGALLAAGSLLLFVLAFRRWRAMAPIAPQAGRPGPNPLFSGAPAWARLPAAGSSSARWRRGERGHVDGL